MYLPGCKIPLILSVACVTVKFTDPFLGTGIGRGGVITKLLTVKRFVTIVMLSIDTEVIFMAALAVYRKVAKYNVPGLDGIMATLPVVLRDVPAKVTVPFPGGYTTISPKSNSVFNVTDCENNEVDPSVIKMRTRNNMDISWIICLFI